jgi:serine/threonine protein kinase
MLPSKDNIIDALKDLKNIQAQELNGCSFIMSKFGDPLYYPGGFGMVFKLDKGGKHQAFKVWYVNIDDIKDRMQKISDYLANLNLPYFVSYSFCEKGLRIPAHIINDENDNSDQTLDTLVMDWAEGDMLKEYLDDLISENSFSTVESKLLYLAQQFKNCFRELHRNKISHGDLQHGNIIIEEDSSGNPQIKLIDYDSLYVPALSGCEQTTSGIGGFQHPRRIAGIETKSTEKDDYFSEKIIYLTLLLLAKEPDLWTDPQVNVEKNDYGLLFNAEDFVDFKNSYIYRHVKGSNVFNQESKTLIEEISDDLNKNVSEITALQGTVKSIYKKDDEDTIKPPKKVDPGLLGLLEQDNSRPINTSQPVKLIDIDPNIYKKKNP